MQQDSQDQLSATVKDLMLLQFLPLQDKDDALQFDVTEQGKIMLLCQLHAFVCGVNDRRFVLYTSFCVRNW